MVADDREGFPDLEAFFVGRCGRFELCTEGPRVQTAVYRGGTVISRDLFRAEDGEEGGQVEGDRGAGDGEVGGGDAVEAILVAAVGGAVGGVEGPDVGDAKVDVFVDPDFQPLPGVAG